MHEDEAIEEPKKKRLIEMRPVKVIRRQNKSSLVEWVDGEGRLRRAMIPADKVEGDGRAADDVLAQGIAYGLPWAEMVTLKASPEQIEAELHRLGIWTGDDLRGNTAKAVAALQRVYGVDLAALLQAATRQEQRRK